MPTKKSDVPHTCGNCNQLRFTGAQQLIQERGNCCRDYLSGRCRVGVNDEGCPEWSQRTKARVASDQTMKAVQQDYVNKFNLTAKKARK